MRTKQEEHRLIETFDQTTASLKTEARPLFAELLKATEEYQKSLAQTAFSCSKLTEVMKRVVAISPDPEMNKSLEDIHEVVSLEHKLEEDLSKFMLTSILVPMRQQHDDEKKSLPEFIKKVKAQRKASEKACKDAQVAAQKAGKKGGAQLQEKVTECSKKEQERQQLLSDQLKQVLGFQRSKFCLYVKVWTDCFLMMGEHHDESDKLVSAESEMLQKIGASANEVSSAQADLVTERKRTYINLANISDEWKKIFKDAGISKKDLRDSETAKMLIETLERAGINTSSLTGESFSAIGGDGGDDEGGAPPPPSRGPPPPPRRGGGDEEEEEGEEEDGPRPPPRGAPPPPPSRRPPSYLSGPSAPAAPAAPPAPNAPAAPPPPPPRTGGAAPPPTPSRGGLLDQIQQGTKLRSAADRQDAPPPPPERPSNISGADLSSMLMSAMATRRVAMKDEPKDEDEDWEDNDEWSD